MKRASPILDGKPTVGRFTITDASGKVYLAAQTCAASPRTFFQRQLPARWRHRFAAPGEFDIEHGRGPSTC
ncbi:MAG: hypothetical protein U0792_07760 [Gemmataceae bacterium]